MKIVLTILLLLPLLTSNLVLAQDLDDYNNTQSAIGVDPAIIEEVLDESTPSQKVINISNLSNLALPIKTTKVSFTPQDKLNYPEDKLEIYDASSWISISPEDTDFILQPQSTKKVTLTIQQPPDASPGGHYATVYFEPLIPAELISQRSVFVYGRAAVLVFMQTRGDIVENLKINKFTTGSLSESSVLNFNMEYENIGNVHLLPSLKINLYDDLQNTLIETIQLNPSLIIPGTQKVITESIDSKLTLGKVSAQMVITYGASNLVLTSERVSTIILPYKALGIIVIIFLLFLFLRKRIFRAFIVLFDIKVVESNKKVKLNTNLKGKNNFLKRIMQFRSRN